MTTVYMLRIFYLNWGSCLDPSHAYVDETFYENKEIACQKAYEKASEYNNRKYYPEELEFRDDGYYRIIIDVIDYKCEVIEVKIDFNKEILMNLHCEMRL